MTLNNFLSVKNPAAWIVIIFALFFSGVAFPQTKNVQTIDTLMIQGMEYVFNLDFTGADSCAGELQKKSITYIQAGYLQLASAFYKIISGAEYPWDETAFIQNHDAMLERIEKSDALTQDESVFYTGCVYGNLARYWGATGNWVKAFYYARKAKTQHESISKGSVFFHDAQLAPGVYNYYAATLPKWLGAMATMIGLGGDKGRGLLMLNSTAQYGILHRMESLFMLIQILINEGKYEQALDISKKLLIQFPDNPYLRHQTGLIYFLMERYDLAEPMFMSSYEGSRDRYVPCEQMSAYHLGRIEVLKNRYSQAIKYFQRALFLEAQTQKLIPTHGWIIGSSAYYLGISFDCEGDTVHSAEAYKQAAMHEHTDPLIRQKNRFRLKYPMNDFMREAESLIHHLSYSASGLDSLTFIRLTSDDRIQSIPGLSERLHFAYGKRLLGNNRYMDAVPYLKKAAEAKEDFPERSWLIPYSHYYLAYCMATVNDIIKIQEHLKLAGSFVDYPGEERARFLYNNLLKNVMK